MTPLITCRYDKNVTLAIEGAVSRCIMTCLWNVNHDATNMLLCEPRALEQFTDVYGTQLGQGILGMEAVFEITGRPNCG